MARETVDKHTGVITETGFLKNLFVRYNPAGVLSVRGSLPVFLRDSNVETMTRLEIQEAVLRLASRLGFDPHDARVFQLDLAATMLMPRRVACYLSVLAPPPRYKPAIHPSETATFSTKNRSLVFYDKARQASVEGNLLRFEVQFIKKLKQQLGWAVVAADLYDPSLYPALVERWKKEYRRVRKMQRHVMLEPTPSPRQLERQFATMGLGSNGGEAVAISTIDTWPFSTKKKSNLRKKVRELSGRAVSPEGAAIIAELDAAVERAARLALGGSISLDL